jgi:DNA mismatch endonuclease (patch repair protein)
MVKKYHSEESKIKMSETRKRLFREGKITNAFKGKHLSENHRKKLSEIRKKLYKDGKIIHWSKIPEKYTEISKKISEANKGRQFSDEHRKRLSESHKGQIAWNKGKEIDMKKYNNFGMSGKHHKEESKEKMSLAKAGKHPSPKTEFKKGNKINLGRFKTKEVREKISKKTKEALKNNDVKIKLREHRLKQIFPKKDTKIEIMMQEELKKRNIEFVPHQPVHFCQPDMFIKPNICIFCDGDYWHANPQKYDKNNLNSLGVAQKNNIKYDERNNSLLKIMGYKVFRFWETDIKSDVSKCVNEISEVIKC